MAALSALQVCSQPRISLTKFRVRIRAVELSSSKALALGHAQLLSRAGNRKTQRPSARTRYVTKDDMAGEYEEAFADISEHLTDLFTYKAVRTVLNQLQEMDPTKYRWLYNFTSENRPSESYKYCKTLYKENRELAERILVTRLALLSKWLEELDHSTLLMHVSDNNLQVMRDQLKESVNFMFTAKPRPEVNE